MTQISEWGPHLWKVLHGYAEHAGNSVTPVDEIRAWIHVLRLTEGALPCAMCRAHYRTWRTNNPLEDFLSDRGEVFREKLRHWLWAIHDSVNGSRNLEPDQRPSYEDIATLYRDIPQQELYQSFTTLVKILEKAILHRQVNPVYVADWRRALLLLRKLL